MQKSNRRIFFMQLAATGAAIAAFDAHAQAKVDPKDAQAQSLGYVEDTTKADAKKFPNHTNAQMCGGCQLYQGKASDAAGPCGVFAGKLVASKGWCSAWTKKAA